MTVHLEPPPTTIDTLAALRQRNAELERQLTECHTARQSLQEQVDIFFQTTDLLDEMVLIKGPKSQIVYANRAFRELYAMSLEQLTGLIDAPFNEPDYTQQYIRDDEQVFATGQPLEIPIEYVTRHDGALRHVHTLKAPVYNSVGQISHTVAVMQDITERKHAEETLRQSMLQEEKIHAQQVALEELSTPMIPITDRIVVMPLIGAIDSRRAQQVMDSLLYGVANTRAETAIIDITGVSVVDTQVANALVRAAASVQLLGARVMITGIRPEVAQTLVGLGVDLRGIGAYGTLSSAIATAMAKR
jgi:rsbT co-antagonist protein RsbR